MPLLCSMKITRWAQDPLGIARGIGGKLVEHGRKHHGTAAEAKGFQNVTTVIHGRGYLKRKKHDSKKKRAEMRGFNCPVLNVPVEANMNRKSITIRAAI